MVILQFEQILLQQVGWFLVGVVVDPTPIVVLHSVLYRILVVCKLGVVVVAIDVALLVGFHT